MNSGVGEVPFRKFRGILLDLRREAAWENYLQWLENRADNTVNKIAYSVVDKKHELQASD